MRVVWAPRAIASTLKKHTRRGHKVPELDRDEIRQVLYGKHRLIYRLDPKRVVVLTIRHSRQEWDSADIVASDL